MYSATATKNFVPSGALKAACFGVHQSEAAEPGHGFKRKNKEERGLNARVIGGCVKKYRALVKLHPDGAGVPERVGAGGQGARIQAKPRVQGRTELRPVRLEAWQSVRRGPYCSKFFHKFRHYCDPQVARSHLRHKDAGCGTKT